MQIAVTWAFFDAHWETVTSRLSEGLAGDVAWAVETYKDDPSPKALDKMAERAEESMSLSIALQKGRKLPTGQRPSLFASLDRSLRTALDDRLDDPFWFDTTRYPGHVDIRVQVKEGVLRIIAPRDRAFATQGHIFILWMVVATLLLTAVAILFIRNQVRAIERLADAADAFGRGIDTGRLQAARRARGAPGGRGLPGHEGPHPAPYRAAHRPTGQRQPRPAHALTRLKLEIALAEPSPRLEAMARDLSEMEHMIDEYLAFARGEGGEEARQVMLRPLIEDVCEGAERAGAKVEVSIGDDLSAILRPQAFKRALANLIDNAAAHGETVRVSSTAAPTGGVWIFVDDDGPGIPEDRHEEAFRPFNRLDESRNQNEKGVGLGLAIARDMARGLGGELTLQQSPMGGLRAVLRLPG
jgi:two-component system osmolarity sensor histidine kinase EnvZ